MCTHAGGTPGGRWPPWAGVFRVLPIGDSITVGFASTVQTAAWRGVVASYTWPPPAEFCAVDIVGPVSGNAYPNNRCFAYSGETIQAFNAGQPHDLAIALDPVTGSARLANAAVILLGTNNAIDASSAAAAPAAMLSLLQYAHALRPPPFRWGVTTITPKVSDTTNGYVQTVNAGFPAVWDAMEAVGMLLDRADAYSALNRATDFANDGHPNDAGHGKLGTNVFYPQIRRLAGFTS